MATIRKIDAINPIEGADAIEVATVGGWKVVVKKGEYNVGDLAVYCEIDSFIPSSIAPFLTKPGQYPKVYGGVEGERLRTVKLRGQVSQGLLLPIEPTCDMIVSLLFDGLDVSFPLRIQKYEPPIPAQLSGEVLGTFPSFIRKTDQERIQNLTKELSVWIDEGDVWEVTEKLDGTSMTVFVNDEDEGVCSRNLNLKRNEENSLWAVAIRDGLIDAIRFFGGNLALQGELIGEGIQGNKYKVKGQLFYVFDIFDIDSQQYFDPIDRNKFCEVWGINHVPVLTSGTGLTNVEQLLKISEGKSALNPFTEREGLVYKHQEGQKSFKVISNKFLLKGGE